jgi:hypothetical protein
MVSECRIEEALKIFNLREPKGPQFDLKKKKLYLDIGWVMFNNRTEYSKTVDYFKTCITGPSTSNSPSGNFFLDPREIVLMFKDLHEGSYAISGHLKYGTAHKTDIFKAIFDEIRMKSDEKNFKSYE